MEEPFIITVSYKGGEKEFEARLQVFGYSHRFHVDIEGTEVIFERDEEGHYRAILPQPPLPQLPENGGRTPENSGRASGNMGKVPDTGLLQSVAEAIERILA
jgi:hypothetical protein